MTVASSRSCRAKRVASTSASSCQSGFTLIELMVAIAVLAIVLAAAIPSFSDITLRSKLRTYAADLVASAQLARSEAINRNGQVRMCVSSNGTSCGSGSWEQGWIVLHGSTVIHRQQAIAASYRIISSEAAIVFQSSGVGATLVTLDVCRATPTVGAQGRRITVSATGRTSVSQIAVTSCSST